MCNFKFVTALQQLSLQTVSCYYYFYYVISKFRTSTGKRYGPLSVIANVNLELALFNVMARLTLWLV